MWGCLTFPSEGFGGWPQPLSFHLLLVFVHTVEHGLSGFPRDPNFMPDNPCCRINRGMYQFPYLTKFCAINSGELGFVKYIYWIRHNKDVICMNLLAIFYFTSTLIEQGKKWSSPATYLQYFFSNWLVNWKPDKPCWRQCNWLQGTKILCRIDRGRIIHVAG